MIAASTYYYIADSNDEAKFQAYLSALPLLSLMTHHCGRKTKWYNVHLNPSDGVGDSPEDEDLYEQFEDKNTKPELALESEGKESKPSNETASEKSDATACEVILLEEKVERPLTYRKSLSVDSSSTYDTLSDMKDSPGRGQRFSYCYDKGS